MGTINLKTLVPIDQMLSNAGSIFKMVDKYGRVIILQNNKPAYILVKYEEETLYDGGRDELQGVSPSYKLHEAMQIILDEQPDKVMHAADLADEIFSRGLYLKRDGTKAMANQIRARSENYSHLFEVLGGNHIKLREI